MGPRLGDQEDRRPPFLKTEKNKAPASESREWLIQRRPGRGKQNHFQKLSE